MDWICDVAKHSRNNYNFNSMKIHFERTGGFSGLRLSREIDSADLSPAAASRLARLLRESRFFELPEAGSDTLTGPDRFYYRLTIQSEEKARTFEVAESAVPSELRPLLEMLTTLCRPSK